MLYKSSKSPVVSFVYNGKSLFRKLMSQFIMGWGRKWSFEILFMLIQLREFVSSLVRLGRENLHVLINISCHNGRGGGGRGGGGVGRQRRHRFDLERSAAPTRGESPPALPPSRPLPPSSRPRQTAACGQRRRNKTVL